MKKRTHGNGDDSDLATIESENRDKIIWLILIQKWNLIFSNETKKFSVAAAAKMTKATSNVW